MPNSKKLITSASLITLLSKFSPIQANLQQILKSFTDKIGNSSPVEPRQLSAATIQNLNEYGCWCYFDQDHGRGKGHPVNEIDAICKTLHDGYECAMMDWEEERPHLVAQNKLCVPWEVRYNSATDLGGTSLVDACTQNNRKICSQRACMIEGQFVLSIYQLVIDFYEPDASAKHSNGFDPTKMCKTTNQIINNGPGGGGGSGGSGGSNNLDGDMDNGNGDGNGDGGNGGGSSKPTRMCCGDYPARFPYDTMKGTRKCCVDKTYFSKIMECCDGNVQLYGSC